MEISTIITIAVCAIVIIGFTVFVLQKSKPLKVKTEHGLDESAAELAEKMMGAGTAVVDKVADTISNVADKAANAIGSTLAPLASGVGQILESVADRVKVRQTEVNTLKTQAIALVQEVERLKNRQIDMTQVTAQLKLGLISVSQQYSSWERTTIETKASGVFTQGSETEFISLHRANYLTQVGIDIEQLRFQIATDNRIQVFGLRNAEILGIKDLKVETVINEIRKFTSEGTLRSGKAEIFKDDSRLAKLNSKHHSRVLDEIQDKQSIEHLKDTNARFALAFLQARAIALE